MRVYKCDHCGKFIKWSNLHRIEIQVFPPFAFVSTNHLCKDCYRILRELIKEPDGNELRALLENPKAKKESE